MASHFGLTLWFVFFFANLKLSVAWLLNGEKIPADHRTDKFKGHHELHPQTPLKNVLSLTPVIHPWPFPSFSCLPIPKVNAGVDSCQSKLLLLETLDSVFRHSRKRQRDKKNVSEFWHLPISMASLCLTKSILGCSEPLTVPLHFFLLNFRPHSIFTSGSKVTQRKDSKK